ncbi:Protein K01D12.6 [Aphelenchoides avenae]|nr:Protein K01D12.6 [Aphelenchus avenae]
MSAVFSHMRSHPRRILLIGAGVGACLLAWRILRGRFTGRRRALEPPSALANDAELDTSVIDDTIRRLEALLHRLEAQKFNSERDRSRYELISSVLSRLKGIRADLDKFSKDELNNASATEDIARSVWNAPPSSRPGTLSVLSDDSFISACDEFINGVQEYDAKESISVDFDDMDLYRKGLTMAEKGEVKYRKTRADLCNCESETDFAAKLWCIRQAFTAILSDGRNRQWLIKTGRVVIADLLRQDKKDPADFYAAYDRMMDFLNDESNRQIMKTELTSRRVEEMNLWDVLFDFVFLDAFEDLRKPPSGIAALMRNSFLSRSMKEATLNNLIWSLIKAKRSRLQVKNGFVSHFYDISSIVSLSLTMGLLGGSDKGFEELCAYFKENILGFVAEIFNPSKMRYTTVKELAEDVKKAMETRLELIRVKISYELPPA